MFTAGAVNTATYAGNGVILNVDTSGLKGKKNGNGPTISEIADAIKEHVNEPGYFVANGTVEGRRGHALVRVVDTTKPKPVVEVVE